MRCSCRECGTYMIHSESTHLGCVCPECGARCKMCLGTNTVVAKEDLKQRAMIYLANSQASFEEEDEYERFQ